MSSRHIAIVAPPLPGHWDPLRVLAAELVRRGHRVTFLHMADAAELVGGTGFKFEPVGQGSHGPGALAAYRRCLARAPRLTGFMPMLQATADMSAMLLRDLPGALERIGADAVVADETEPAAALAARHLNLPYVTSITGLPLLRDPQVPPPFVGWRYRGDAEGERRNASGWRISDRLMRPIRRVLEAQARAWGVDLAEVDRGSPLLQVAQCPGSLDFPRADLPASLRYCGPFRRPEAASLKLPIDPLPTDRPLVYCSLGSLQGNRPRLFAQMSAACADLGARAIVAHGGLLSEADARRLPGEPLVADFWPQPAVLPHCRAALLHGGFNTVLDALAAGVPMVVRPLAFEQPGTAARVVRAGAGVALTGPLTRGRLRRALGEVLGSPVYRDAATRMAGEMSALPGAAGAAALIDEALRSGPTPLAAASA